MLRVWGGGVFLPEEFYSACDEAGIMVYHDMMCIPRTLHRMQLPIISCRYGQPWFGGFIGTPLNTPVQDAEIRYNIRRLSHHASIVLWNGGNEWQGSLDIFDSFVLRVVAEEDPSRPLWPISPSAGWASGVCALTGLPNGRPLKSNPIKGTCRGVLICLRLVMLHTGQIIETHGPYQHGSGFKTVNAPDPALQPFPANIPPSATNDSIGVSFPGHFASEFGCRYRHFSLLIPPPLH
jgi:beta-mannosidase